MKISQEIVKEALKATRVFTSVNECRRCGNPHPVRYTNSGKCVPCSKAIAHDYFFRNKEKCKDNRKAWVKGNPEKAAGYKHTAIIKEMKTKAN